MLQDINTLLLNKQIAKNDGYEQVWIDFLCSYGSRLEYIEIEKQSKGAMFAIMEYRRLLRSRGLGNIPFITLNTAHVKKDYIKLHTLLQELFLEAISENQFQYILEQIDNVNDGVEKLYDRHMQDKNKRILNRVMFV